MHMLDPQQSELLKSLEDEAQQLAKAEAAYEENIRYWRGLLSQKRNRKYQVEEDIIRLKHGQLSFDDYCAAR
jgi:hypothetical protein